MLMSSELPTLMSAFDFDAADLDANRSGRLSQRQKNLLRSQLPNYQRWMGLRSLPLLLIVVMVAMVGSFFFFGKEFVDQIPDAYVLPIILVFLFPFA
jgi:hypothetical protein